MTKVQKKQKLELVLNQVKRDDKDPTKVHVSMIILDTETSRNNVNVSEEVLMDSKHTILGMPIVAKYIKVSEFGKGDDDFGDHEAKLSTDKNGNDLFDRDTIAIGSFTTEGYMETLNIDGEDKRVFMADGVLWYSRYKDACDLLIEWVNEGKKVNMSCEYLFSNYAMVDGEEVHLSPIYWEGHCVLGANVTPAYESATIISLNQMNEFNRLVAQANSENNKEVNDLEEVKNEEQLNTEESVEETEVVNTEEQTETDSEDIEENEEVQTELNSNESVVDEEPKTQLNAISLYDISDEIRGQIRTNEQDVDYLWVSDLYTDSAIVAIETDDSYKHYKFNYTIENDTVTVDLSSKVEVKEKREWVTVTNELSEKVNKLTEKFTNATNTITQLNAQLDELKPIKEQMELAQKQEEINSAKKEFESKFNSVGANELFESQDIQDLIAKSIEDGEIGLEAKLILNSKIVEFASEKLSTQSDNPIQTILNTSSKRENLIEVDEFDRRFKL